MGGNFVVETKGLGKTFKTAARSGSGFVAAAKAFFKPAYKTVEAVADVDFRLPAGEIRALIGPNGAGKSTLIKMLCGVLHPSYGSLECLGVEPWRERLEYVRKIGAVFGQKTQLMWDLPASDSFFLNKKIYKIPEGTYKKSLEYFKDKFALTDVLERPVRSLSLGERMKCELVAALLHEPALVFLDEPTIGMDIIAKETLRRFVRDVNKDRKVSFILTTHDLGDVENLCKRITVINSGRIVFDKDIDDLRFAYGGSKLLSVRFTRPVEAGTVKDALETGEDGMSAVWELPGHMDGYGSAIAKLTNDYPVADITIKNPEIETIIRDLYTAKR
jgi:ABC-2 type transport system ATP-binding protein